MTWLRTYLTKKLFQFFWRRQEVSVLVIKGSLDPLQTIELSLYAEHLIRIKKEALKDLMH